MSGDDKNDPLSYVDFGTPRDDAMSDPSDLVYLELADNFFWMTETTGVRFGEDDAHAFSFELPSRVIFDTGTSITYYPSSIENGFLDNIIPSGVQI
eukprot:CAMPEP_0116881820 /NCGR_PEP_ID=MMETSP0463-20121206/13878_1 /TAXON_ID=181622 /ORGANISM="Strombidinopsis sp, Strain SopsisLIS2011" /LENGTH=95 /DNA_ID=CAMNT_0004534039 /DNA_START=769 /DNA_END=1056 /DNA_ORIENTATION=+